jgi:hypothetical protein
MANTLALLEERRVLERGEAENLTEITPWLDQTTDQPDPSPIQKQFLQKEATPPDVSD